MVPPPPPRGRGAAPPDAGGLPGLPPFPPTFGRARVDLDPLIGLDDATKPLRSRLLAVPDLRARYLAYVQEIAQKWLDWNTLEPLVRQYQSVIAEEVKADTRKLYHGSAFRPTSPKVPEPQRLRRSPASLSPEALVARMNFRIFEYQRPLSEGFRNRRWEFLMEGWFCREQQEADC